MRNKCAVPERICIILGYARERLVYRIYDSQNNKAIEEQSTKFNEILKGTNCSEISKIFQICDIVSLINKIIQEIYLHSRNRQINRTAM